MATSAEYIKVEDKELLLSRVTQLVFEDALAGFECRRCERTLITHYMSKCGHAFCANCKRVLTKSKANCPLPSCRKALGDMDLQDIEFERKLFELRAHCPNRNYGCPFISKLKDLGAHLRACKDTRDNALPVLIEGNDVVQAIMRELSSKFDKLSVEMAKINKNVEDNKTEMMKLKETVEDNRTYLDKKMEEMIKQINENKTEGETLSQLKEIYSREIEGLNRNMEKQIELLKEEMAEKKMKEKTDEPTEYSNLEQKVISLERMIQCRNPQLDCFSLGDGTCNFQPDFTWKISGIEEQLKKKIFEIKSEVFQWGAYPVHAQLKFEVKADDYVYMSLCLEGHNKGKAIDLKIIPKFYYVLRDQSGNYDSLKNGVAYSSRLFTSKFHYSLSFEAQLVHKSCLMKQLYNVNDSVLIETYVETPKMNQLAYSHDGTLNWTINNCSKWKQLLKENVLSWHESPYFYTGPKGYRVQVRMGLNGFEEYEGKGLTAMISFVTGEFDADLPLTFAHRTTITLFNRKDPQQNIIKTVDKNIATEKSYLILMCDNNETEKVIDNDTIYYKLTIKPSK